MPVFKAACADVNRARADIRRRFVDIALPLHMVQTAPTPRGTRANRYPAQSLHAKAVQITRSRGRHFALQGLQKAQNAELDDDVASVLHRSVLDPLSEEIERVDALIESLAFARRKREVAA